MKYRINLGRLRDMIQSGSYCKGMKIEMKKQNKTKQNTNQV